MKILKILGIVVLMCLIAGVSFFYYMIAQTEERFTAGMDIPVEPLEIPSDSASIANGAKWVNSFCAECHGLDLGGKLFFDDPDIGQVYSPNLTPGQYGLGYYQDENWIRALRHGISGAGRALFIMPSKDYVNFYEEDLVSVIAYLKNLPPVDREKGKTELTPFAKFLVGVGAFGPVFSAEYVDHDAPIPQKPYLESAIDRGKYITAIGGCATCHGKDLKGMQSPDPNSPPGADLTSSGNLANWDITRFKSFIQTGRTPEGKEINNMYMPWQAINRLGDDEVENVFAYLKSLGSKK